jgi:hypothetical protein
MDIQRVDPHLPNYVYEKSVHPDAPIVWRQYEKTVVEDVDKIVELSHGNREVVKTSKDWEILEELLKFYIKRWPQEFAEFKETIPNIRHSRRDGGYSKSKETMYVGAIPPRFMKLIKVIFPQQQFDKKFVWKMVTKIPLFRVGGVNNLPKSGTII